MPIQAGAGSTVSPSFVAGNAPTYCSREELKAATDAKETARNDAAVDRAVDAASRNVERLCHRLFYPTIATRYFDWPNYQYAQAWRLWLDSDELISVTTLVAAGTTISSGDYLLEPYNSGPPYTRIEIDLDSSATFGGASSHQRAVAVTGVFGYSSDTLAAGSLTAAISSTSATTVSVSNSSAVGVGDAILVDSEWMLVTGKAMVDTTQNASVLTASNAGVSITGVTAATINVGETILIDSERMLVVDVAGTTLTVKRPWDGSVLAAHLVNADIYAPRTLTVTRGALGSTAATHLNSAAISRYVAPGPVKQLTIAEALVGLSQEGAGWSRVVGAGEGQREFYGRGLRDLREQVYSGFGRTARKRAV